MDPVVTNNAVLMDGPLDAASGMGITVEPAAWLCSADDRSAGPGAVPDVMTARVRRVSAACPTPRSRKDTA